MPKCIQNSLSDQVYTMLKDQILSGQLKGGMKIPEESLAEQFGVSRTPIREAIRRLAEYGLITIKPRSHATVSLISEQEANDIARVRVTLEQLAIDSIDEESYAQNVKELSRYAADCQYAMGIGDRATVFEQDSLFHLALIRASRNSALISISERLDAKIQQLRIAQNLPEDELAYYLAQHAQMMTLLKNGDKEACKRMLYEHITHDLTSHVMGQNA
ncbi:GntR family transcriptional regulator [Sphaerochaeta globosa]|uniref:Transcriptional regulator, GntR family n=1 Tax=Sphaerochaeta globosa (strain ATCC BAA-1886 / DSM 22777 / Buddy) TaxID=158189 RepID=F0RZM8_SPHGB|nr:GntR family transcriptional regulator [Sphaerochaeta globosa]ADY14779.1 transcriptional regulator, GntR family [Sphaerochaeta globosa str. Buddy]